MPSDRLDIDNCRCEAFFQKVVEIDQHLRSHGLQSSNGKVFTILHLLLFYDCVKEEFLSLRLNQVQDIWN
jgi:hypothetical protein